MIPVLHLNLDLNRVVLGSGIGKWYCSHYASSPSVSAPSGDPATPGPGLARGNARSRARSRAAQLYWKSPWSASPTSSAAVLLKAAPDPLAFGSSSPAPQHKPTLWEDILLLGAGPTGERSGPPPRLAVEGRSSGTRADAPHLRRHLHKAHAASPRGVAHGRGPRLAPRLPRAWG